MQGCWAATITGSDRSYCAEKAKAGRKIKARMPETRVALPNLQRRLPRQSNRRGRKRRNGKLTMKLTRTEVSAALKAASCPLNAINPERQSNCVPEARGA
jgi:hypothetical protein